MGTYAPLFTPGKDITYTASADITAGQVVEVTGDRLVGPAAAASKKVAGVALFDAKAGQNVTVTRGGTQRLLVSSAGAVAAGDLVAPAAAGTVVTTTTGGSIGLVVKGAAAGARAQVNVNV
jgi:predicted RecA/RadA family phage recombinase